MLFARLSVLSFFAALVSAVPLGPLILNARDVFNPPITSPSGADVWKAGATYTVTWDVSELPPDDKLSRPTGKLVLGYKTEESLNLMYLTPLAEGFKLRDAKAEITLPDVVTRSNYIIVLMGDSGNASPLFTIEESSGSSVVSAPASSVASSVAATPRVPSMLQSASVPPTSASPLATESLAPSPSSVVETSSTPASNISSEGPSTPGPAPTAPAQNTSSAWFTRRASTLHACAIGLVTSAFLIMS